MNFKEDEESEEEEKALKDIVPHVKWITKNRSSIAREVPALENVLDELVGFYLQTEVSCLVTIFNPAPAPVTGSFTSTGQSASFIPGFNKPSFNVSISGTFVGSVQLERSFDESSWLPLTGGGPQIYLWSSPASEIVAEVEPNVSYRLNCTAYTSGTINYRISQ